MQDNTNQIEVRLFAMRRSGSHAFLNWVCSLFDGPACFVNDATRHPPKSKLHPSDDLPALQPSRRVPLGSPKQLLLYNLEDTFPSRSKNWCLPPELAGESLRRVTFLLLRDPYNLFASRIRSGETLPDEPFAKKLFPEAPGAERRLRRMWIEHAREYLRQTTYLDGEVLPVSYNRWLTDPHFRLALAKQLGGVDSDVSLSQVTKYGFGSSFEGPGRASLANRIGLLHRWRHYFKNERYRSFMADESLRSLSFQIFGPVCDLN